MSRRTAIMKRKLVQAGGDVTKLVSFPTARHGRKRMWVKRVLESGEVVLSRPLDGTGLCTQAMSEEKREVLVRALSVKK